MNESSQDREIRSLRNYEYGKNLYYQGAEEWEAFDYDELAGYWSAREGSEEK